MKRSFPTPIFLSIPVLIFIVNASIGFAAPMSDAQVAAILMTANEAELNAAKIAEGKATDVSVRDFADHMIDEHSKNQTQERNLVDKLSMKVEPSAASTSLKDKTSDSTATIDKLSGGAFNTAYINQQVAMHQQLLSDLTRNFIPNSKNADFKSFLEDTKTHVEAHLALAKKIQAQLAR